MNFQELLIKHRACEEARAWVGNKTAEQAWEQCARAGWMFWLVGEIMLEQELKQEIVHVAADIARAALVHTTDQRVRDCVAAVDRWLAGEQVDLRAAEAAAVGAAAARAADTAWAARAAWAAARTARTADTACAARAAWAAAEADAAGTAEAAAQARHVDIIRKHIPWTTIQPLLERAMQETT